MSTASDKDVMGSAQCHNDIEQGQCAVLSTPNDINDSKTTTTKVTEEPVNNYLHGWRLHSLTFGMCSCLFLSALDITIVSTALVSITNDLEAFRSSSWIVTSYLLTYSGFMVIWAKLSDVFGRRLFLVVGYVTFLVFSGACAGAQTVLQLIILRAFQGIGAAGIFSMGMVITPEMVPPTKYGIYNSLNSISVGISFLLGPLIGGAITDHTTWRWIFAINIPIGVIALILILVAMPANFPHHSTNPHAAERFSKETFAKVDFLGCFLYLGACIFFVCALEEAGIYFPWQSSIVICFLVLSGVLLITFLLWSWYVGQHESARQPFFPWKFTKNRVLLGVLLEAMCAGLPFTVSLINFPQKFQAANGASPLNAAIRLLPFSLTLPIASALIGVFTNGFKVPPIFIFTFGAVLQLIAYALLYTSSISPLVPAFVYGYEAIAGCGAGLSITTLSLMTPFIVGRPDMACAIGLVTQLRVLGGALGIAIGTNLLNNHINHSLSPILSSDQLNAILRSSEVVGSLPSALRERVRVAFGEGYNMQVGVMLGFSGAQVILVLLMWKRKPIRIM